jgi:glutathione S-transferase
MASVHLIIGNKNYSSWSLRGWLLASLSGIDFQETVIDLGRPDHAAEIGRYSPAGKVPILIDGDLVVHETLAIAEYLADMAPEARLWPADPRARARSRALAAEMHAGFGALRAHLPMNCRAETTGFALTPEVDTDVARITAIWRDCRRKRDDGDFLFGPPSAVDAMFAPVVSRLKTYGVAVDKISEAYMNNVLALPAMRQWYAAAAAEPMVIERFEIT